MRHEDNASHGSHKALPHTIGICNRSTCSLKTSGICTGIKHLHGWNLLSV